VILEPLIQGVNEMRPWPRGMLRQLRTWCDSHGVHLILDEVMTGFGRTGRMFACEHWGVEPDLVTLAKGLGSGLPIGALVARSSIMERWPSGAHGNTFGGNPIACAAALATLDLVERELQANAAEVGAYLFARLSELAHGNGPIADHVAEVRGRGLMIGMEIVADRATLQPAPDLVDALIDRAFHNGLLLLSCGKSTLRFMPPLCVTRAEVDEAVEILTASFEEALAVFLGLTAERAGNE
jgi:4-aminobutyrate aminotransferase